MADPYEALAYLDLWSNCTPDMLRETPLPKLIDAIGAMKDLERALVVTIERMKDEIGANRMTSPIDTFCNGEQYVLEIKHRVQHRLDAARAKGLITQALGGQALQSVMTETPVIAQYYKKRPFV